MNKETKKAILDSIEHHKRMQKWVKTQDKNEYPSKYFMLNSINKNWYGTYCPLCQLFMGDCDECPLGIKFGKCSGNIKTKNTWGKLIASKTWAEWLKWDKKLVKQLKSLL